MGKAKAAQPKDTNAVKINMDEDSIVVEFGLITEEAVEIHSAIRLDPRTLKGMVDKLTSAGLAYEEEYDKNIGFRRKQKSRKRVTG